jgi:hypothetical protein
MKRLEHNHGAGRRFGKFNFSIDLLALLAVSA